MWLALGASSLVVSEINNYTFLELCCLRTRCQSHLDSLHVSFLHFFLSFLHFFLHVFFASSSRFFLHAFLSFLHFL